MCSMGGRFGAAFDIRPKPPPGRPAPGLGMRLMITLRTVSLAMGLRTWSGANQRRLRVSGFPPIGLRPWARPSTT